MKSHEHMHYTSFNFQQITFPIFSLMFLFGEAAAPLAETHMIPERGRSTSITFLVIIVKKSAKSIIQYT